MIGASHRDGDPQGDTSLPIRCEALQEPREAIREPLRVGGSELVDYTFSGGRRIKKALPGSHALYTYDGYGRLTQIHHKDTSSGNTLAKDVYGYDASSQIIAWDQYYYDDVQNTRITGHHLDEGDQYKYDGAKRLISVLRGVASAYITDTFANNLSLAHYRNFGEFAYDQTGNRVTRRLDSSNDQLFTHDKANQISTEGGSAVSHDKSGNYTGASNALKYTWNNQWGQYITAGGSPTTHNWHYDALGRKVQWNESRTYHYYYDGDQIVEHVEYSSGTETARKQYVWNPDRIDDLVMYEYQVPNPDVAYYVHEDHLGSVQALVDGNGAIQEGYRYWEWGQTTIVDSGFAKLTVLESPTTKNNVRFAGRDQYTVLGDVNDAWYNNRARVYRSKWGRFAARDPLSYEEGSDPYVYARSTPAMRVDPSGMAAVFVSGGTPSYEPRVSGLTTGGSGGPGADNGFGFHGKGSGYFYFPPAPGTSGGSVLIVTYTCPTHRCHEPDDRDSPCHCMFDGEPDVQAINGSCTAVTTTCTDVSCGESKECGDGCFKEKCTTQATCYGLDNIAHPVHFSCETPCPTFCE